MDTRTQPVSIPAKSSERKQIEELIVLLRELRGEYAILYHSQGCPIMPRSLATMMTRIDALVETYHQEAALCSR